MNVIDSLDIKGMKQTDFMQLREMFNHVIDQDVRWDREDYWNDRNKRLKEWLDQTNESLIGNKISPKK